ncbi:hypothetical protein [Pseudanabaena sp. UWO311]|uniref:hypothetical protein n=1 Tax=Pseudanabaena sp. UWO311 TaxID=2487337 RepID=UPI0030D8072A
MNKLKKALFNKINLFFAFFVLYRSRKKYNKYSKFRGAVELFLAHLINKHFRVRIGGAGLCPAPPILTRKRE